MRYVCQSSCQVGGLLKLDHRRCCHWRTGKRLYPTSSRLTVSSSLRCGKTVRNRKRSLLVRDLQCSRLQPSKAYLFDLSRNWNRHFA